MKVVQVVDGTRTKTVPRDPDVGDYDIGVSLRYGGPEKVVLHNTSAVSGVRVGRETVWPTRHMVVPYGTDFTVDETLFRVVR